MRKELCWLLILSSISVELLATGIIDTTKILKTVYNNSVVRKLYTEKNSFAKILSYNKDNKLILVFETTTAYNEEHIKEKSKLSGYIKKDVFFLDGNYETESYYDPMIRQIGKYVNNLIEGTVLNYSNDKVVSKYSYAHGKINGSVTLYDKEEKVQTIYEYKNDTLNGSYSFFYNNGRIQQKGGFCQGVVCGNAEEYYKSGAIKIKGKYSGKYISSFKCDTCKRYSFFRENKQKVDLFKTYSLEFRKEFFDDFNINQSNRFKYPLKEGEWIYYDEKGDIEKKVTYDDIGNIKNN